MNPDAEADVVRVLDPGAGDSEEEALQSALRPRTLDEFIGQEQEKRKLRIAIQAARERGEALEHLLLDGPPGLGKTTLSMIVAHEMGTNLISTSGPVLEKTANLMGPLTRLLDGDVLFIDEIHRTPRIVEEYLYPAMEDFKVDFMLEKGPFGKAISVPIKPFTLVGATTRPGLISSPLHERFGLRFDLDFYDVEDLTLIVLRSARLLGVAIQQEAATEIASRSRGTPRIANRLLRRVRDFAQVQRLGPIVPPVVEAALELEGVDARGLDNLDRRYLRTLIDQYEGGPAGVGALAATMQLEQDTLEDVVEPFLLHVGFILRTSSGRRASPRAYQHLGLRPKRTPGQDQPLLPLGPPP